MSRINFRASLPQIQGAIRVSGNGDGMRVQFDIPEIEMVNALELLACRGVVLNVTVEIEPPQQLTQPDSFSFDIPDYSVFNGVISTNA